MIFFNFQVMDTWNKGELDSFLIEITANILRFKDENGKHVLPQIRDAAGQVQFCIYWISSYSVNFISTFEYYFSRKALENGPASPLSIMEFLSPWSVNFMFP